MKATIKTRLSGAAYHSIWTMTADGQEGTVEDIYDGAGKIYKRFSHHREHPNTWEVRELEHEQEPGLGYLLPDMPTLCPNLSDSSVTYLGEDMVDGMPTRRHVLEVSAGWPVSEGQDDAWLYEWDSQIKAGCGCLIVVLIMDIVYVLTAIVAGIVGG